MIQLNVVQKPLALAIG